MSAAPFSRPPGDAAAVYDAARRFGAVATSGHDALSRFTTATQSALADWDAPVGVEFAEIAGAQAKRMRVAATQVEGTAGALRLYGDALLAAQDEIDALTARWLGEQQTIDANTGTDGGTVRAASIRTQGNLEQEAAGSLSRLNTSSLRIAAMVDESTAALVKGGGTKTPEQLYQQVMAAWTGLVPNFDEWKKAGATAGKVIGTGNRVARAAIAVKAYADLNRAETLAAQTKNLALAQARVIIMEGGRYNRIPGQLGILARDIADARRIADDATTVSAARSAGLLRSIIPATRLTRGLAVIGVVGGLYDLAANPLHETGPRRGISIGMDVVGVGAGGTAVAASLGLIALGPVGVAIVGGALLVTAGWAVGTYVYDHWDDISHGASVATQWVGDRAGDVKDGIVDGAKDVASGVKNVAGGVKDLGGGIVHGIGGLFS